MTGDKAKKNYFSSAKNAFGYTSNSDRFFQSSDEKRFAILVDRLFKLENDAQQTIKGRKHRLGANAYVTDHGNTDQDFRSWMDELEKAIEHYESPELQETKEIEELFTKDEPDQQVDRLIDEPEVNEPDDQDQPNQKPQQEPSEGNQTKTEYANIKISKSLHNRIKLLRDEHPKIGLISLLETIIEIGIDIVEKDFNQFRNRL